MTPLHGHTSPETAYIVEDYPYGFRLRTKIRYWIETKSGQGQRMMSQTINPKTHKLNKPKAGTYSGLLMMVLDDNQHVQSYGLTGYASESEIDAYEAMAEDDSRTREAIRYLRAQLRVNAKTTWTVHECQPGCTEPHQTQKEQAEIHRTAVRQELWNDTMAAIRG